MSVVIPSNVITIDCHYMAPKFACAYLLIEDGKAVFIENNTQFALPWLIAALEDHGLTVQDVEYIIITHLHLDHAGGTAALAERCPNATVLVHQRAARHIIDPTRLIEGVTAIYGKEKFKKMYGAIKALPESRVRIVEDGERIKFGNRVFYFFYTLGHAKHHMCIYDSGSKGVFTGDAFGLCFLPVPSGTSPFIIPSTPPSDFDPIESIKSLEKIIEIEPGIVYLTHFGPFTQVKEGARSLAASLRKIDGIIQQALDTGLEGTELDQFCLKATIDFFDNEMKTKQVALTPEMKTILKGEILLNAQGVALAAQKRRSED